MKIFSSEKTIEEKKKSVSEMMGEAAFYIEFPTTHFPFGTLPIEEQYKILLFHASLLPISYFASQNQIKSNDYIWYNAVIKPMFYRENIVCEIGELRQGSCFYYFKARLSDAYILGNCDFK